MTLACYLHKLKAFYVPALKFWNILFNAFSIMILYFSFLISISMFKEYTSVEFLKKVSKDEILLTKFCSIDEFLQAEINELNRFFEKLSKELKNLCTFSWVSDCNLFDLAIFPIIRMFLKFPKPATAFFLSLFCWMLIKFLSTSLIFDYFLTFLIVSVL